MVLQPYGTTIAVAVLVGAWVVSLEVKRMAPLRQPTSPRLRGSGGYGGQVWEALPWVLVFGLIGARAYHVLHLWEFYRQNLEQVLFVWNGGLGIYGALAGGLLGLGVFARRGGVGGIGGVGRLLDLAAPGVAIGQAIGRFANFFSQELYGWPTKMPWGIYIAPENRFPGLENFSYFHPLFLYEALWCLLGVGVLLRAGGKGGRGGIGTRLLTGERFLLYLSFYALGRFFLEGMRIESWMVAPLSGVQGVRVAQAVSIVIVCGSIVVAIVRRSHSSKRKNQNLAQS